MTIEKGIPISPRMGKGYGELAREMEVGDSVRVEDLQAANSLMVAFKRYGRRSSHRKQEDGGFRVWRIS